MTDTILQAITQHLQEQYPQLHIALVEIPAENIPNWKGHSGLAAVFSEYVRLESPRTTWCPPPHCYIYHTDGTINVLNEHFQDTPIDLSHPDSIQQIHTTIQKILQCNQPNTKNGKPSPYPEQNSTNSATNYIKTATLVPTKPTNSKNSDTYH